MDSWREEISSEYIDLISGYAFKSKNFHSEEVSNSLPVIKIKNVANGDVNFESVVYHLYQPSLKKYLLCKGDVLIAMTGNHPQSKSQIVGDVSKYKLDSKSLLNQRVGKIIAKENADLDFIYYLFKSKETHNYLANQSSGSANQANISKANILSLELRFPLLSEQKAIAEVLSSLDDKIDLLHRQNETLEAMAETLFRQWFVEEAEENWKIVSLGEFVKTNQNTIKKDYPFQEIRYLDTGSLTENKIEELKLVALSDAPSRAKRLVNHNNILYSTVRPNQKHYGLIQKPNKNLVVSTGFCVIECDEICPFFVYVLLTGKDMIEYLHSIAEGSTSTYPSLKPSDLEAIEFKLPNDDLLKKFSDYCSSVWEKIYNNKLQIKTLENLRNTLLPKLMSGEVRVKMSKSQIVTD